MWIYPENNNFKTGSFSDTKAETTCNNAGYTGACRTDIYLSNKGAPHGYRIRARALPLVQGVLRSAQLRFQLRKVLRVSAGGG